MEVNPVHSIIDLPSSWVQLGKIISTTDPRKLLTEYLRSLGIDDEFTRKLAVLFYQQHDATRCFPCKNVNKNKQKFIMFPGRETHITSDMCLPTQEQFQSFFVSFCRYFCCLMSLFQGHVACRNFSRRVPHTCKLLSSCYKTKRFVL